MFRNVKKLTNCNKSCIFLKMLIQSLGKENKRNLAQMRIDK